MTSVDTYEVDPLLVETVDRLLAKSCEFKVVEQAESDRWCASVWDGLAEAGFPWISVPSDAGGSDGSLADAMAVLRSVGSHAAPVPVAETGVLGGWLLAAAGFDLGDGPLTVVPDPAALTLSGDRLLGEAAVAWAQAATQIAALVSNGHTWSIVSVRPDQVQITPGSNLAGEPRDQVRFDVAMSDVQLAPAPAGVDGDALLRRGALSRVVMMAGAAETMSQLVVDYTNGRRQFGQPIARFQAVQQHLVTTAQHSVKLSMAADAAVRAASRGPADFEIAAAVLIADAAVVEATRATHQAHGAMGVTREYPLHHLSRRLWSWRHEFGGARYWRPRLGAEVAAAGADRLFETVTR